ncbi:MAG: tetratricopeptide repeat protein [Actinobacteria bacterium]|nr:tetratricopeptide repeat protein [Actinomycetota bacterium]
MRIRTKLLLLVALAAAMAAGTLLSGVVREGRSARDSVTVGGPGELVPGLGASAVRGTGLAARVEELEADVRSRPDDEKALVALGHAYLQRWRVSGDASYLPRAEKALGDARRLAPANLDALTGLGSLALTRHEFRRALAIGEQAVETAPYSVAPRGVLGDAPLELGRYPEAFATFEKMVSLKPTVASYARIAYARELLGNREGAAAAMQLALDSAGGQPEAAASVSVELAKLAIGRNRLTEAERHLRAADAIVPGFVYAKEQRARVEAARGRLDRAIALAQRASEAVPMPQFLSLLADLQLRAGRKAAAQDTFRALRAIDRLSAAGGLRADVEQVLVDANHGLRIGGLVERAKAARAARPSIWGDDALAWALARTGRCTEARAWSDRSLRLGTKDGHLLFHRAYIERCTGNGAAARVWARRAIDADPHFSVLWSPVAHAIAR